MIGSMQYCGKMMLTGSVLGNIREKSRNKVQTWYLTWFILTLHWRNILDNLERNSVFYLRATGSSSSSSFFFDPKLSSSSSSSSSSSFSGFSILYWRTNYWQIIATSKIPCPSSSAWLSLSPPPASCTWCALLSQPAWSPLS